jgi:hypothetical protein
MVSPTKASGSSTAIERVSGNPGRAGASVLRMPADNQDSSALIPTALPSAHKTITVAFTGASGLPYGVRLVECLLQAGCRVWLLYSQVAQIVARQEMDWPCPRARPKSRPSFPRASARPGSCGCSAARSGSPRRPPAPTRPTPWWCARAPWPPWPRSPAGSARTSSSAPPTSSSRKAASSSGAARDAVFSRSTWRTCCASRASAWHPAAQPGLLSSPANRAGPGRLRRRPHPRPTRRAAQPDGALGRGAGGCRRHSGTLVASVTHPPAPPGAGRQEREA